MSAQRTITVHTRDHGPVTLPEPAWCLGRHRDGEYLADTVHEGPETSLVVLLGEGRQVSVLPAGLVAYPRATTRGPEPTVAIEMDGDYRHFGPAGLEDVAQALVAHAAVLRALAHQLAGLLASGGTQ
ncbi:hypothetical protein H8N00_03795 [Streptomyces sp. AC563]|uniref:DUF6907 domain-containing protein n=1 Tax=Streptomyces buecherae TaxID=2763006 RepID=UPI00164E7A7D|nr:hypothetical protein [Streptomyces buecherae]MBC3988036.1 hypothetical protein [Streptomyces buecherae]